MSVWYAILNALGLPMFEMDFMKNALLAVLLMAPLFGLLSTMIVTGRMSFFSDALGHSGFTGIAIGALCGAVQPIYFAVGLSVLFALLFSFVRSRTSQSADTIIGVFSSTAVALGIFIATLGGNSFTKFKQRNRRAGGAAEVIRRNKPEHGACERAEHGKQVVLAQIPREVPGRRGGQDEKGIDDHQAHPAHGERDDDGNADREECLRFFRRNAARGGKLRMHRRQEQPVCRKYPQ